MLLKESLNSCSEQLLEDLEQQGFHVIDHALPLFLYENLVHEVIDLIDSGELTAAGTGKNATQNDRIRRDQIRWHQPENYSLPQSLYAAELEELRLYLNQTLFLNLNDFESHYAFYDVGDFYGLHRDQFHADDARQISVVYYLNEHWNPEFGGELILKTSAQSAQIEPIGNRMVVFRSGVLHEVKPAKRPRYSIASWLRRRKN